GAAPDVFLLKLQDALGQGVFQLTLGPFLGLGHVHRHRLRLRAWGSQTTLDPAPSAAAAGSGAAAARGGTVPASSRAAGVCAWGAEASQGPARTRSGPGRDKLAAAKPVSALWSTGSISPKAQRQ